MDEFRYNQAQIKNDKTKANEGRSQFVQLYIAWHDAFLLVTFES